MFNFCVRVALLTFTFIMTITNVPAGELTLYFGATDKAGQDGLCSARFNTERGIIHSSLSAGLLPSSSFLAVAPNGKTLYALNDALTVDGSKTGGLSAFQIQEESGALKLINSVAMGGGLCHLSTDATGKWLLGAAYSSGHIGVWPLAADGSIGERTTLVHHEGASADEKRQTAAHPHQIVTSPDNRRVFVADLGLDKVMIYDFDVATGALAPGTPPFAELAPGAGPRHIVFHPSNGFLYVVNELDNTVTAFENADGGYKSVQAITTIPADFEDKTYTAEIAISPNGRFLYATNRGHHSIAAFSIEEDGRLRSIGITSTPAWPQHFAFDPSGKWLLVATRDDHSVTVFRVDENTGALAKTGQLADIAGGPMCVIFKTSSAQ